MNPNRNKEAIVTMMTPIERQGRRAFLGVLGTVFVTAREHFADELERTPSLTEGPFYPDRLPLDTDNDLLISAIDWS